MTENLMMLDEEELFWKQRMEKNKAVDPDNIPTEFYHICWDIVKEDIVNIFQDFHAGHYLHVSRINYGTITLLPKSKGATKIQEKETGIILKGFGNKWLMVALL
ncbi:hypothetical protein ACJX0J_020841, partial [Zea mays]